MKDEEMAEEYLTRTVCQGCRNICEGDCAYAKPVRQAFLAGLKTGRPQWHKITDGDLPKDMENVIINAFDYGINTCYVAHRLNGKGSLIVLLKHLFVLSLGVKSPLLIRSKLWHK